MQNIFFLSKPKVVYLRPFSSSLPFPKFRKKNVMYFVHKHVESGPSCLHKLVTFLKYHIDSPWRKFRIEINFESIRTIPSHSGILFRTKPSCSE